MKYSKITPAMVAQYLGISAQTVRERMKDGSLNIGKVYESKGNDNFLILPGPLYEETGIKLNGYEPPPTVNIDYCVLAKEIVKEQQRVLANTFKAVGE